MKLKYSQSHEATTQVRRKRAKGFTIIEVAIAATVMALVLATSITVIQHAYRLLDRARSITIAGQIMQSEFEKMRLNPWTGVNGISTLTTNSNVTIDTVFTSNRNIGSRFVLARDVSNVPGAIAGMKRIALTVTWTNFDGRQLSRGYATYYGENGLYDYYFNSL
ncbi:MAG: prepilin-type N-terminal cleavage/methylation domain-containing protein [Opitutus sp.]